MRVILLVLLAFILFWTDLSLGSADLSFSKVLETLFSGDQESTAWITIHLFRLPRALTSLFVGIALSVSGLQMQTVFRNPLAGPYVLGISSGASLGVALVVLGFGGLFAGNAFFISGSWLLVTAAWIGSGMVLLIILTVSFRVRDIMTLLILGIMFASGISAVISVLQYFSGESALKAFVIWTMGSVSNVSREQLPVIGTGVFAGLILALVVVKASNAIQLGETQAKTLGINITRYRAMVFISTSLLTGTVTAFCGPIGFIGIAVPHICRMFFQTSRQGILLLASIFAGASLMLLSDIISQLPGTESILPINAVTSLLGIPVVVWIIFRKQKLIAA
ncbi:MAG: iron ABC transporter permease [Bacteroidales bacterium]|nr:iron ABC transporter permease [Bacteroidales bacterium]